jgi:hypothetical protein
LARSLRWGLAYSTATSLGWQEESDPEVQRRGVFVKGAGDVQQHRRDCRAVVDEALAREQFNRQDRLLDDDGSRHAGVVGDVGVEPPYEFEPPEELPPPLHAAIPSSAAAIEKALIRMISSIDDR